MSFFDVPDRGKTTDLFVQSANFDEVQDKYVLSVKNKTSKSVTLPKDFVFGEVVCHPHDNTFATGLFCTVLWGSYQLANYTRRSFRGIPAVRMVGEVEPIGGHAIVRLPKKAREN